MATPAEISCNMRRERNGNISQDECQAQRKPSLLRCLILSCLAMTIMHGYWCRDMVHKRQTRDRVETFFLLFIVSLSSSSSSFLLPPSSDPFCRASDS